MKGRSSGLSARVEIVPQKDEEIELAGAVSSLIASVESGVPFLSRSPGFALRTNTENTQTDTIQTSPSAQIQRSSIIVTPGEVVRMVFRVDLRLSRLFPAAGMNHIVAPIAAIQQHGSLRECSVNLVPGEVRDFSGRTRAHGARLGRECVRAGNGELFVLIGAGCSAYAHAAD